MADKKMPTPKKEPVEVEKKSDNLHRVVIKYRLWIAGLAAILLIIVLALVTTNGSPLPATARQANFPVYYPTSIPAGYKLQKNTVRMQNNVLFFSFSKNDKQISVSEQASPKIPPNLEALKKINPSFKTVDTVAGQGALGLDPYNLTPVAIIETNTTLISVTGTKDIPSDIVNSLIQSLRSLPE